MKRILVTGGMGLIGRELVEMLEQVEDFADILVADIKDGDDISDYETCKKLCKDMDEVYHLVGVKGSPKMTKERPVDFMKTMLMCDTAMICAAQEMGVKKFLYTSSIAVEHSKTDTYPAWAKATAEKLIEAMRIQYPHGTEYVIVRPSNVYGRFDNFQAEHPMVITALIKKAMSGVIELYGDGKQSRDFINAKDVARGMIQAMEEMPERPVNLCSGKGVTIKHIAQIIAKETGAVIDYRDVENHVIGDTRRVMKINWNFKPEIEIKKGVAEVCRYVRNNQ